MVGVGNIVSVGGTSGGGGSSSGIQTINPGTNIGPTVTFEGANGIGVTSPNSNTILIDGVSLSGQNTQFSSSFISTTSGSFEHNLGTRDLLVQVYDNDSPPSQILPDKIVYNTLNKISVLFNRPQSGRVVIIGSGISCSLSNDVAIESRRYALLIS